MIIKYITTLAMLMASVRGFTQSTYKLVSNNNGATLGYSSASGLKIIRVKGLYFKDLNRNGRLDKYEDWRLSPAERAKDLVKRMSVEQIAGLMLYSGHQSIPGAESGTRAGLYGGQTFLKSGAHISDLTDQQKAFLKNDNLRHVLVTTVRSPKDAALWNNNVQAFVAGLSASSLYR